MNSGWRSISEIIVEKVRFALRRVSASGQSQARSIWACPVSASEPFCG